MKPAELNSLVALGVSALPPVALSPLTGRDTEVSLLTDRWEQAQEGMAQIVSIVGEPGLGKSRLVQTIKQHVRDASPGSDAGHASIIEWRCAPQFQNTGLHVVADYFDGKIPPKQVVMDVEAIDKNNIDKFAAGCTY